MTIGGTVLEGRPARELSGYATEGDADEILEDFPRPPFFYLTLVIGSFVMDSGELFVRYHCAV